MGVRMRKYRLFRRKCVDFGVSSGSRNELKRHITDGRRQGFGRLHVVKVFI
jgi:hypothetical protein